MNKHYTDARYYIGRAVTHIREGLSEDLRPVANRVRERLDIDEPESETVDSRVKRFRTRLRNTEERVQESIDDLLAEVK